jgi:mRNA interferase RelE/StbE
MRYTVTYSRAAFEQDRPRLNAAVSERLSRAIQEKLLLKPEYFSKPLQNTLKGHRSLRVGAYRIIFTINGSTINIWVIGHRSKVYQEAVKRLIKKATQQ